MPPVHEAQVFSAAFLHKLGHRTVICVCVCDAQVFQSMLKLRGSTFLYSYIHQRTHESNVLPTSLAGPPLAH